MSILIKFTYIQIIITFKVFSCVITLCCMSKSFHCPGTQCLWEFWGSHKDDLFNVDTTAHQPPSVET